ncbi:MAG TPA: hypothetical protein PLE78_14305 [Flavobacteriales bacterium]|jgi:hypothetical protein|nr:hypothetical protein [Flavobacteriales bacterium]HQW42360.1 hypothetical protein [Flavobacteriales bacterium]
MKYILNASKGTYLVYAAALLLAACSTPSDPGSSEESVTDGSSESAEKSGQVNVLSIAEQQQLVETYFSSTPAIDICQLEALEAAFDEHIFRDANGNPLSRTDFNFRVESLESLLKSFKCGGVKLMTVHYGLDEVNHLTYAIGFTCYGIGMGGAYTVPTKLYISDGAHGLRSLNTEESADWLDEYQGRYMANVHLRHGADLQVPVTLYDPDVDVRYTAHTFLRLDQFIGANTDSYGRKMSHIEIVSFADKLTTGGPYYHGHCLVGLDEAGRLVDDQPSGPLPFNMRGMDLGSPCPDNCGKFVEKYTGVSPAGCH